MPGPADERLGRYARWLSRCSAGIVNSMITVRNVTKSVRSTSILHDVTFTARDGAVTGLIGPNGAGKTTTLRISLGLTRPDSGHVQFDGCDYRDLDPPLCAVGSVLDARSLPPRMRAADVLTYCAHTQGVAPDAERRLVHVGLDGAGRTRVASLSLGMRQRLSIAVALLGNPRNLILDEPLNGLDPGGIAWLRRLLTRLRDDGCAILLSSHIISELALVADDVVVIDAGRVRVRANLAAAGTSLDDIYRDAVSSTAREQDLA